MATTTATRRLAAILAADVAGYSRLVEAGEDGTLQRLTAHLAELVAPKITSITAASSKRPATACWRNSAASSTRCAVPI
jgi:adenylate cyclase